MSTTQDLSEYLEKTQDNLVQLIALERTLSEQVMQQSGESSMSIYIQQISERKEAMYNSLREIYSLKKDVAAGVAVDYKNVMATSKNIENELEKTDNYIKQYKDLLVGANRMNEIATYEYKKYQSYRDLIKVFVYFSITIIALTFLIQQPWFPKLIGKGLIILLCSYAFYMIGGILYWNFRREDKYWDKFRQDAPQSYDEVTGEISLSKWEHNKRAISKALDSVGGSEGICKKVIDAGGSTSDQFFSSLDDEIASGMTSSQQDSPNNMNIADLSN
tara:strand:+ start:2589 stop:3413 length:825 start_codon:yes stop_codon:yes gene_type:complete